MNITNEELGLYQIKAISIQADDGLQLHGWSLMTEGDVLGNVIIVHGMKDYSGRYLDFARKLSQSGFNVFGIDLRGHAQSEGERVFFESNAQVLGDLDKAFHQFKLNDNGRPWFLFGHSAGGSLAARYMIDHEDEFSGFILSAPLLKRSDEITPFLEKTLRFVNKFAPHLKMVDLKDKNFSKDPAVVQDMRTDPLIHNIKIPASTAVSFLDNVDYVMDHAASVTKPFLILHSQDDKINTVEGSKDFFAAAGASSGKELKLYNNIEHDLFHEPEHALVEADVLKWLKGQVTH